MYIDGCQRDSIEELETRIMEALKKVKSLDSVENKDMADLGRLMRRYEVKARRKINDMSVPLDEGIRIIGRLYWFYRMIEENEKF